MVELMFSSTGRMSRAAFLACAAVLLAIGYAYAYEVAPRVDPRLGWIVYPLLLFPTACILSKRLHDRGRAGWWAFVPVWALVEADVVSWPDASGFFPVLLVVAGVIGLLSSVRRSRRSRRDDEPEVAP